MSTSGVISGTPTTKGSYTFVVGITDSSTLVSSDTRAYTLKVL